MSRVYGVQWVDGNFERTASIVAFSSTAARVAYPKNCKLRFEKIDAKRKNELIKSGSAVWLALWDKSEPNKFVLTK